MNQKLKLHRLQIEIIAHAKGQTETRRFGTDLKFTDGINVIHAANTMGKSTCMNAILYALGLEMIIGRKGPLSLTDALWGRLMFEGIEYEIDKSRVSVEISNSTGEEIVVSRSITDPDVDPRIVKVQKEGTDPLSYLVNDPGAAQGDRGFYKYLADFMGWDQPLVVTYEGGKVPLYLECIFPMFFIEQKRGWTKILANIPSTFGIRHAATLAIQFILKLDIATLGRERDQLKIDIERAKAEWNALRNEAEFVIRSVGGVLEGLPIKPPYKSEEFNPQFKISLDTQLVSTELWINHTDNLISSLQSSIDHADYNSVAAETELSAIDKEIQDKEYSLQTVITEYGLEKNNLALIEKRMENIVIDIKKNSETLKIQRYAKEIDQNVIFEQCPACGQDMQDTLMPPELAEEPMSISDNIAFLKEQQLSAVLLRKQSIKNRDSLYAKIQEMENELNIIRRKARDMRIELRQDVRIPKVSQVRELAKRQDDLEKIKATESQFKEIIERCRIFLPSFEAMQLRYQEISKEGFSEEDLKKIEILKNQLRTNLADFHFTTRRSEDVDISLDTYLPVSDGIDLSHNASASDNVRMIFAYTLGILETSNKTDGYHPGFVIYDEMRQHDISVGDLKNIYAKMNKLSQDNQFIVTSSSSPAHFREITDGVPCNVIEVPAQLISPMTV